MNKTTPLITKTLLRWHSKHGRTDLPWKKNQHAYAVWVSEVMLQQTQVATVIPYYQRFMQTFVNVKALAFAPIDEVLHHWAGLGYYARARNLHKAANVIQQQHQGVFPSDFDSVLALPGVGRSTAGAIMSFAYQQPYPILDANVKRVLSRFYAISGWAGEKKIENILWGLAQKNTPQKSHIVQYTQAIMDFGATVCSRKPHCQQCDLRKNCRAFAQQRTDTLPYKKPKKNKPRRRVFMLLIKNKQGKLLLQLRPDNGIWGGLWSFPEVESEQKRYQLNGKTVIVQKKLAPLAHSFSHFHLEIIPLLATMEQVKSLPKNQCWYHTNSPPVIGLAAPIETLLTHYQTL